MKFDPKDKIDPYQNRKNGSDITKKTNGSRNQ